MGGIFESFADLSWWLESAFASVVLFGEYEYPTEDSAE